MKYLYLLVFISFSYTNTIQSQNSLAKIEYAEAETEYQAGNYAESLAHLETVKEMLGSTNAKVMYLEILSKTKLIFRPMSMKEESEALKKELVLSGASQEEILTKRLELIGNYGNEGYEYKPFFEMSLSFFESIKNLAELSDTYIVNFESSVPVDKLKEIYDLDKVNKQLAINIDDIIKAQKYLDSKNNELALPLIKKACTAGNPIGCNLLSEAEKEVENTNEIKEITNNIESNMILVEGGTFTMGDDKGSKDARPAHEVTVKSFYLSKFELNNLFYTKITKKNNHSWEYEKEDQLDKIPQSISRERVLEFISILNETTGLKYRLPTEAEWEFAARGGNKSLGFEYSGGNNLSEVGRHKGNGKSLSHIGSYTPNELGFYDMSGNIREWCQDFYSEDYYENSPKVNPQGPEKSENFVVRGGSYLGSKNLCKVTEREVANSSYWAGIRLALDVE